MNHNNTRKSLPPPGSANGHNQQVVDSCKRNTLFLLGCIPVRLLFAYAAYKASPQALFYLSIAALFISMGFAHRFYTHTPAERGFFGSNVWWNNMRLVHATLMLMFFLSVNLDVCKKDAWKILVLDAVLGLVAYGNQYGVTTPRPIQ